MDYEKIGNRERAKLTIEATAAQDFKEIRRLLDTCPKETVTIHNLEYLNTFRMLARVATIFEAELRGLALTVHAVEDKPPVMAQITAAKEAWARFCAEHEVDPAVLIQTTGGHHPAVSQLLGWCCLPAEPALLEHWLMLFQTAAQGEVFGEVRH